MAAKTKAQKAQDARDKRAEKSKQLEANAAGTTTDAETGKAIVTGTEKLDVGASAGELGAIDAPKVKRTAHDVSDKETGLAEKFHREMDEKMAADKPLGIHAQARQIAEEEPALASEEDRRRLEASKRLGVNVFPRDADEVDLPSQAG